MNSANKFKDRPDTVFLKYYGHDRKMTIPSKEKTAEKKDENNAKHWMGTRAERMML